MQIRYARIIIGASLLAYSWWLLLNNAQVSSWQIPSEILLFSVAIFAGIMLLGGFVDICLPKARIIQSIIWLILIFVWYSFFQDMPSANIYLGDILRILGAWMVVAGIFWWCISPKCKQKAQSSKIQIIEV